MNITERAAIVLQEMDAALALAEKATPGPWLAQEGSNTNDDNKIFIRESDDVRHAGGCWLAEMVGQLIAGNERDNAAFIATSRTLLPTSLLCLKTSIDELLEIIAEAAEDSHGERRLRIVAVNALTTLCDQWEAGR